VYESRTTRPLTRRDFLRRVGLHAAIVGALFLVSLGIGILGYHYLDGQAWLDAFVNSGMLLGGMGQVGENHRAAGKVFAGIYALFAGLLFIVAAGLLLGPPLHRLLHTFHWDG